MIIDHAYDVVIVGAGAAGLTAALHTFPLKTLVLTKTDTLESGSTPWAQGGITFPVDEADMPSHRADTLAAGAGFCRPEAVDVLVSEALQAQDWLEALGYPFDRKDGKLLRGREGGHSVPRILHAGGDASGKSLSRVLLDKCRQVSNITLQAGVTVLGLVTDGPKGPVKYLRVWSREEGFRTILCSKVILAGGGMGQLFGRTTNPPEATGDALALGLEAGASAELLEMVQFHPTGMDIPGREFQPLLTEALRGAGANLVTEDGSTLKVDHPLGVLGTRDLVARAVYQELHQGGKVYMDAREKPGPDFPLRFPSVFQLCMEAGYDPRKDLLPIAPVVHYHMGGLKTGLEGRTDIPGLWAVGECASSGVHGANRLASNSLLECLVFGRRAGLDAAAGSLVHTHRELPLLQKSRPDQGISPEELKTLMDRIQNIVYVSAGPVRSEAKLRKGLQDLETLTLEGPQLDDPDGAESASDPRLWREAKSFLTLAPRLLNAALDRKESAGAHYRE